MDKSAKRVAADNSYKPEHKQNYKKGPKHRPDLPRKMQSALGSKKTFFGARVLIIESCTPETLLVFTMLRQLKASADRRLAFQ
jgi:hypothetical protein